MEDVKVRINKARQAFGSLREVWRSTVLSQNIKLRLFNSNVISVLLYGSETWLVTKAIVTKLQVFANRCLRRILKIRWYDRISNSELLRLAGQLPLELTIGRTLRRGSKSIACHALTWNPQGSRSVGRPKKTWKRTVIAEAKAQNKSWREVCALANNRVRWRQFVLALHPLMR